MANNEKNETKQPYEFYIGKEINVNDEILTYNGKTEDGFEFIKSGDNPEVMLMDAEETRKLFNNVHFNENRKKVETTEKEQTAEVKQFYEDCARHIESSINEYGRDNDMSFAVENSYGDIYDNVDRVVAHTIKHYINDERISSECKKWANSFNTDGMGIESIISDKVVSIEQINLFAETAILEDYKLRSLHIKQDQAFREMEPKFKKLEELTTFYMNCSKAIGDAITTHYDINSFKFDSRAALSDVMSKYDIDVIQRVVANTVKNSNDGGISSENKKWANSIDTNDLGRGSYISDKVHIGLINMFADRIRLNATEHEIPVDFSNVEPSPSDNLSQTEERKDVPNSLKNLVANAQEKIDKIASSQPEETVNRNKSMEI